MTVKLRCEGSDRKIHRFENKVIVSPGETGIIAQ